MGNFLNMLFGCEDCKDDKTNNSCSHNWVEYGDKRKCLKCELRQEHEYERGWVNYRCHSCGGTGQGLDNNWNVVVCPECKGRG